MTLDVLCNFVKNERKHEGKVGVIDEAEVVKPFLKVQNEHDITI